MADRQFHHFGVPTDIAQDGEIHMEDAKLFVTDPENHPYRIEFLRFEDGSPMPELLQKTPHAAFVVPSLDEAIAGQEVVLEPTAIDESLRIAFIRDGHALIELMEKSDA